MRKLAISLLPFVLMLLPGATSARAASDHLSLTPLHGEHFPTRAYVLTVPPGATPGGGQVHVTENGAPVTNLTVAPASGDVQHRLGEVLLIDTSASMKGRPIAAAMSAARAFATRRGQGQPLAVIGFNGTTSTLLPFTTDSVRISAALATPPATGGGTHVYDAVRQALSLVRAERLAGASLVLLSDGADVGSTATSRQVLAEAAPLHARVYGIGLRSAHFEPGTLEGLASGTQGAYTEAASPKELSGIYRALGSRLANEYVLRYRSLAGPLERVTVTASVTGVSATGDATYQAPALAVPEGAVSGHAGWTSSTAVAAFSVLVALLLATALVLVTGGRLATVRDRVQPYVSSWGGRGPTAVTPGDDEGDDAAAAATSPLAGRAWWERFCLSVEISRLGVPPSRLVAGIGLGTLAAAWLFGGATGHPALAILAVLVPIVGVQWVRYKARRQRLLFAEQLADNLQIVASALRAGHGFVGALSHVIDDAPEPSRSEFRRVLAEEQLGTPIEEALNIAVDRMENTDLHQVALVANVQRQTGGNAAEVLDRVVESIRERNTLRRLIRTLTAQGRLSGMVISALPAVLVLALAVLNPAFIHPLLSSTGGNLALGLAGCLTVVGWIWIRRIVDFDI